jgi:hypothetical protein
MCLTNALLLSLLLLRAVMQPEIRRTVFRTHADGFLEGEVDAVAKGREEGGVEGGRLGERGDGEGDVCKRHCDLVYFCVWYEVGCSWMEGLS